MKIDMDKIRKLAQKVLNFVKITKTYKKLFSVTHARFLRLLVYFDMRFFNKHGNKRKQPQKNVSGRKIIVCGQKAFFSSPVHNILFLSSLT